jgi:hypothetical protein
VGTGPGVGSGVGSGTGVGTGVGVGVGAGCWFAFKFATSTVICGVSWPFTGSTPNKYPCHHGPADQ